MANLFLFLITLGIKMFCVQVELCLILCPLTLVLSLGTTGKSLVSSSLLLPFKSLCRLVRFLFFKGKLLQCSQPCHHRSGFTKYSKLERAHEVELWREWPIQGLSTQPLLWRTCQSGYRCSHNICWGAHRLEWFLIQFLNRQFHSMLWVVFRPVYLLTYYFYS